MSCATTSSQTVGPFFHIGLDWLVTDDLVAPGVRGDPVSIEGRITDGDAAPVADALVELWQANAQGRYAHPEDTRDLALEPTWKGFGRLHTDPDGRFRFRTVKPGRVPSAAGGLQAPHISVLIMMRGMLKQLTTRIYFPGDPANEADPVLQSIDALRRATLIALPAPDRPDTLTWNVRLRGEAETVFFEY
jgi:protocatechuate 3,4-dioxygenase alpha subunit